jgi:tripartite-type tricarboxylate transporter receptor subunit TctC
MRYRILVVILTAVLCELLISGSVIGSDYPTREIISIAAYGPGSVIDGAARFIAQYGEKYVGKPIIVDNKVGGGGVLGYTVIANAKPDGYTIGILANGIIGYPLLVKGATLHYKKSYEIICQIDSYGAALYVKKGGPYDIPLKEFVKRAKEKPDTITVGVTNPGTIQDTSRAIFEDQAGISLVRVPFPQAGDLAPAVLGGHVDSGIGQDWVTLYRGGKLSVLAVSMEKRDPLFPEIPTFKELGIDASLMGYHWYAAPAKTPRTIINFLADAFKKACGEDGFKRGMDTIGLTTDWQGPDVALKNMEKAEQAFKYVFDKHNIKPQ